MGNLDLTREQLIAIGVILLIVGISLGRLAGERQERTILLVPATELRGIPLDLGGER